jgi:hypothetical protein
MLIKIVKNRSTVPAIINRDTVLTMNKIWLDLTFLKTCTDERLKAY